jgi:hypothetical protein
MPVHPATLFAAWISFAVVLPAFSPTVLTIVSLAGAAVLLTEAGRRNAWSLLRRIRVLLLALLAIYGFATPGQPVVSAWGRLAPTLEGLAAGGLQAWRLILLVTWLATLLAHLGRSRVLAAIFTLSKPLSFFGFPADRFAVRLWLTLGAVEASSPRTFSPAALAASIDAPIRTLLPQEIELDLPPMTWRDPLFLSVWVAGLAALAW